MNTYEECLGKNPLDNKVSRNDSPVDYMNVDCCHILSYKPSSREKTNEYKENRLVSCGWIFSPEGFSQITDDFWNHIYIAFDHQS